MSGYSWGNERAGSGGGLRYLKEEPTEDMCCQEHPYSCLAACARQLLHEAGVEVDEADILAKTGLIDGWGMTCASVAAVLDDLHPRLGFHGGAIEEGFYRVLGSRGPWIAALMSDRRIRHAVIVDKIEGELVHVRDPWGVSGPGSGVGTRATLRLVDFLYHWWGAGHNAASAKKRD